MRKKYCFLLVILTLTISLLSGCGDSTHLLEGYWLNEYGSSISFDGDDQVVVDNQSGTYSVYDKNKMTINMDGYVSTFEFSVEDKVLTMNELDYGNHFTYYGDKKKQQEIRDRLEKIAQEQAEHERQLAEEQARLDRIEELKKEIKELENDISWVQSSISYDQYLIDSYRTDIERDGDEYPDLIESWEGLIAISQESIDGYKQNIADLESEKAEYQAELDSLLGK